MSCLSFLQVLILAAAVLASAVSIFTRYRMESLYSLTKPIPLFLIIALFFVNLVSLAPSSAFPYLIFLGLVLGVGGDILLLSPKRFLAGLVAFLLGHVLYIAAFATVSFTLPPALVLLPFAATLTFGLVLLRKMEESARRKYRIPLLLYMTAITLMLVTAMNFDRVAGDSFPAFSAGAFLFCISDGVLAWNRFHRPFRSAQAVILTTYYGAQILIGFRAMCFF